MNELQGLRVVVAGAGAIGSVTALLLARAGAHVVLADPGDPNASAVAAGMLAPVCEALFDPLCAGHYPLLRAARDAWATFASTERSLPPLDRSGALIRPTNSAAAQDLLARADAMGSPLQVRGELLFTPEDWRLEPQPMLDALRQAFLAAGGRQVQGRALTIVDGQVSFVGSGPISADALILATGHGLGDLAPIKGQTLRFPGFGPGSGPVLRGEGVYAAPSLEGLIVGATMEEGLADLAIDPIAIESLHAAAVRLYPDLSDASYTASAGVRAATLDGLPVVGPDKVAGLLVARGARRNGWLLAPLIAQVIAERLTGPARSPAARAFDPSRFVKN